MRYDWTDDKRIGRVRKNLSARTLLEGLAEEAAELSQAALKSIRAGGQSRNWTPVSTEEAEAKLVEELTDVLVMCEALGIEPSEAVRDEKLDRWLRRLQLGRQA